jgi:sulfate transport system permease protein
MPFVVRTVQPVLESLEVEVEEAATTLGASRFQVFLHIIWPTLMPATLTGFALAFARALGEYGSVIFIAGNRAGETEIAPILVMNRLLELDDSGKLAAIAIAVVLLTVSFLMLALINLLEWWSKRRGA